MDQGQKQIKPVCANEITLLILDEVVTRSRLNRQSKTTIISGGASSLLSRITEMLKPHGLNYNHCYLAQLLRLL